MCTALKVLYFLNIESNEKTNEQFIAINYIAVSYFCLGGRVDVSQQAQCCERSSEKKARYIEMKHIDVASSVGSTDEAAFHQVSDDDVGVTRVSQYALY